MNFSQKPQKNQPPTEKFQRSPALFMQLGLVLALFIVYVSLEYSSTKTVTLFNHVVPDEAITYVFTAPQDFKIERKQMQKKQQALKKVILVKPKIVPNDTPTEFITKLPNEVDTPVSKKIDGIIEVIDPPEITEPIDFIVLEEAPIFPGCEGLEKEESKVCFTKQMTRFVNRKFNPSISEGLDLTGKQRIFALFTIGKNGLVTDITIKAPHKRLEKEALRVIQKLPEMIPGKQRKRAVPVKYTLPIVFKID